MHLIDRRNHSPAALLRPHRRKTKAIVLHRIKYETAEKTGVDGVLDFWLTQPWGVATTTIGDVAQRFEAVQAWTRSGQVPQAYLDKAFVPYHGIVDTNGVVHQFLDWEVKGAHAYPNGKLLGVAFIGDFRTERLTQSQCESGVDLVSDLLVHYGNEPDVIRHDDAKKRYGKTITAKKPKGCPGELFAFDLIRLNAREKASIILAK